MNDPLALRILPSFALCVALAAGCGDETSDPPANGPTDPLTLGPDDAWTYYEFEGAKCRTGSPAGVSVSPHDSKNLVIYLEGGGACYDAATCLVNIGAIPELARTPPLPGGIFNRAEAQNPFKDWNVVYVPYCTGDVHTGTKDDGKAQGVSGVQHFVGYTNIEVFLKRLAPTFKNIERVVVVGSSAGGFGAAANVPQVLRAFPKAKGNLIDDSGPPMTSTYLTTCLQKKWREAWGLDDSMLKECGEDCPNKDDDDFVFDFALHLASEYGDQKSGLIESSEDSVIRSFFGLGANDCKGNSLFGEPSITGPQFTEGLLEFREAAKAYASFGTFYPTSSQHTWLAGDSLFTTSVGGVKMVDWIRDIITDKGTTHVGPD